MANNPLWSPSQHRIQSSNLVRFMDFLRARGAPKVHDFDALHRFSVQKPEEFWTALWDFSGVIAQTRGDRVLVDGDKMPGARFFPDARLNFAENLMRRNDDTTALIFRGEDKVARHVTWAQMTAMVSRIRQALEALGVAAGDRVAAVMPNMPETIFAFLASNALGAIWSSCSPDFGERGILDRFGQIEPKILIVCDGYYYNGKTFDIGAKIAAISAKLPSVQKVIVADYIGRADETAQQLDNAVTLEAFIRDRAPAEMVFTPVAFDHPLYILFSSGTTGVPKCIVHRTGGVLLKHLSEHILHCDVKPQDRLFYFTTCGWMMWNWFITALAARTRLLLYDGSPFYPNEKVLFDYADASGMTIFGTSAKYIDALKKTGWRPADSHDLSTVRTIISTGSPLTADSFDFIHGAVKADVHLASVSGGTDLCGCFVGANPLAPVWRGEIQAPCLGLDMDVFNDAGHPLAAGKGELVCKNPFPSMPVGFWHDCGDEKYRAAYFDRFDGVWCHGDFAEWTARGGMIIHGRSDATLNPGGVRIGTAELYAVVEQIDEVNEALAIGQEWDNDVRIVLFVRLADGARLDESLEQTIRATIRAGASPRHVPARIVAVADIPRTKSGKITELAVRDVVHGRTVKNAEALANPEALDLFRALPELAN